MKTPDEGQAALLAAVDSFEAVAMNLVKTVANTHNGRRRALATTELETACMWLRKAIMKHDSEA